MFGLMKQTNSAASDGAVKGSLLGSSAAKTSEVIDPAMAALVQLCAYAFPQMSGATMTGIERALQIEPRQKPALRKFIVDSYAAPRALGSIVRGYKRAARPRHNHCYRLAVRLCGVARETGNTDKAAIGRVIAAAKSLGLSKDETLTVLQQARLAA